MTLLRCLHGTELVMVGRDSYGRGYGRRRGSWSGNSEDVWFCETCRVDLRRRGAFLICESVELERGWGIVFVADFDPSRLGC